MGVQPILPGNVSTTIDAMLNFDVNLMEIVTVTLLVSRPQCTIIFTLETVYG